MPKRSRKPDADPNVAAFDLVQSVTGRREEASGNELEPLSEKNPAAVALGRLGGLKGGAARAKALTKKQRAAIAKKAAAARWKKG